MILKTRENGVNLDVVAERVKQLDGVRTAAHASDGSLGKGPDPISAMSRVFPALFVSIACPSVLLSLCSPPWRRSSRLR